MKILKHNLPVLSLCIFLVACGGRTGRKQAGDEYLQQGPELFARYGCIACHSVEGSEMYGPPLNDIYLKEISVEREGKTFTIRADRKYLKRAITDPGYEKVTDYRDRIMTQPVIPQEDVNILVDYLIGLASEKEKRN